MVEGHSVHRIAVQHTRRLVGRRFRATSPNGRFAEGARLIDGRTFSRIEAIGKNLFAFFSAVGTPDVVMHVHFGMSGRWSVADAARAKPTTPTTRLTLEGDGIVSHLSAMTVDHGGVDFFETKRAALGHDPLRADADAEALWAKVSGSTKSIGSLLMDQSAFAGVGNIYRCEILNVARVHPEVKGNQLTRAQFDAIWAASVRLMGMGFTLGSIVTVSPEEAIAVGKPTLRRWLYNRATCGRCDGPVRSWQIQSRTCYACARCQPLDGAAAAPVDAAAPALFNSHCASESLEERLAQPQKLRVAELRAALEAAGLSAGGKKAELVARLDAHHQAGGATIRSARAAAADKAAVNESRAVEHIAEDEDFDDGAPEWVELPGGFEVPGGEEEEDALLQAAILDSLATPAKAKEAATDSRRKTKRAPATEKPKKRGKKGARAA